MEAKEASPKPEEDTAGTSPPPETATTEAKEASPNASEISMEEIGPEAEEDFGGVVIEEYAEVVTVDGEVKLEAKPPNEEGDAPGPNNTKEDETSPPKAPPPTAASSSAKIARAKPEESSSDDDEDNEDEDFEDETLVERLIGLTEMFPDGFVSSVSTVVSSSVAGAKWGFSMSKSITWLLFSTATVLFLPIMIETERVGIEEAQKQQQRQILLGPGVAASAGQNAPLPKF